MWRYFTYIYWNIYCIADDPRGTFKKYMRNVKSHHRCWYIFIYILMKILPVSKRVKNDRVNTSSCLQQNPPHFSVTCQVHAFAPCFDEERVQSARVCDCSKSCLHGRVCHHISRLPIVWYACTRYRTWGLICIK